MRNSRHHIPIDSVPSRIERAVAWLPQGQLLPEQSWRRRHRGIVALLWLHAVGLTGFGVAQGLGVVHSALEALLVVGAAVLASTSRLERRLRSLAASFGLVTSSALLVHIWGGAIEAHFHFFVVIPILILYQDWRPFLLALAYVVIHHGATGALDPDSVYNHPAAVENPWGWALIHGAFVLAASAASIVGWRASEQMLRDPLTGLPGRTVFLHRVSLALERLKRQRSTLAVLFLDLDRFKALNDSLGHAFGDRLLVEAADRLADTVGRRGLVARLGGDEFAVLFEDIVSEEEARAIAEDVTQAIGRPFTVNGSEVATGVSIGIAFTTSADVSTESLIADADAAMYRAKNSGGDSYVLFNEAMRVEDTARLAMETALRHALERDELRLAYQPIVTGADGGIAGVEALLRWQHPERGLVAPAEFIPIAEQTGLIVPIGEWVLEQACREASGWRAGGPDEVAPYVSVNLSARQFGQPKVAEMVAAVIERTGIEPGRLGLEVTESVLMDEADSPVETLLALKELGVRLFLDDFGTGYSSLSYLKDFPIDVLKVDRAFIAGLGDDVGADAILVAVLAMARALGMSVVAEGVETEAELARVRLLGCELAQGYYFARPQPPEELRELLSEAADRSVSGPEPAHGQLLIPAGSA